MTEAQLRLWVRSEAGLTAGELAEFLQQLPSSMLVYESDRDEGSTLLYRTARVELRGEDGAWELRVVLSAEVQRHYEQQALNAQNVACFERAHWERWEREETAEWLQERLPGRARSQQFWAAYAQRNRLLYELAYYPERLLREMYPGEWVVGRP